MDLQFAKHLIERIMKEKNMKFLMNQNIELNHNIVLKLNLRSFFF